MSDVKNYDQFKLFMTGTEWMSHITHSTDGPLDQKMAQAAVQSEAPIETGLHGSGVRSSLERFGYQHDREFPPTVVLEDAPNGKSVRKVQSDGHHRVATAAAIEAKTGKPFFIPTNYVDNTSAGRRARSPRPPQ